MSKKLYIFIPLILVCLVITTTGIYFYLKKQNQLVQRHHLVCEVLKPGMSKEEVINTLKQVGDFEINKSNDGNGTFALYVNFSNHRIRDQYGAFTLVFLYGKYERALEWGGESPNVICELYQPTFPLTEAPTSTP
jgi:hypothetical protein